MDRTIREVARRAGVSIATVSRVLNKTVPVSEDKRKRVLEAVDAVGYTPNPAAQSLLKKETGGLGVLLPYAGEEFFAELLTGADLAAQEYGYYLLICTSHRDDKTLQASIRGLDKRVDGLVVMVPEINAKELAYLAKGEDPVVCINTPLSTDAVDRINFDNFEGVRKMTAYLIANGHERIALIRGPERAHDAQKRLEGYRAAMQGAGVSDTSMLEFDGDYTKQAGYTVGEKILALDPRPTAIIAANDYCAIGVLSVLHEHGIAVPEEISVAGFDDVPSAQYAAPTLTSVRVPIREIGAAAIRRLVTRLRAKHPMPHEDQVYPVELVVRQSTAPCKDQA